MNEEQLPVAKNKLHGWKHFAGLYAGEHVAATEFVIGATFVRARSHFVKKTELFRNTMI
jgi:hypothetical protein